LSNDYVVGSIKREWYLYIVLFKLSALLTFSNIDFTFGESKPVAFLSGVDCMSNAFCAVIDNTVF